MVYSRTTDPLPARSGGTLAMIRKLLFALGLAALLGAIPVAVPTVEAANLANCTGSTGTNPCPDPLILSTYNGLIQTINAGVTPASMAGLGNFRNLLDNPKFDIYPVSSGSAYNNWAGGQTITQTLTGITFTCEYLAGRWCTYASNASASAQIGWVGTPTTGFQNGFQVGRTSSNANLTQICLVQEVPAERVAGMQGQNVILSFWAAAGANFSAASNNLQLFVNTGTTADEGIGKLVSATPTTINSFTGAANQLNAATQAITTTWTRYGINAGVVPTGALELAVQICYTPVGTAGASDFFQITGVQLEAGTSTAAVGSATTQMSAFEYRPLAYEQWAVGRFAQSIIDTGTARKYAVGQNTSTSVTAFALPLPIQMRTVPITIVQQAFSFATTNTTGTAFQCSTVAAVASSNTINTLGLTCTTGGAPLVAGNAGQILGLNSNEAILATGDF